MTRRAPDDAPFPHWHFRQLVLNDGDLLTWLVIDTPPPPWVEAFRLASRGAITTDNGVELLLAAGHPDADLDVRVPSFADPRGLRHGFISGLRDPAS